jgi:hypothetical protein
MAKKSAGLRDYTRVCRKCGTSRLLPEAAAKDKGPNQRQVASMQRATKYAIGRQREKYSMQTSALQDHQAKFIEYATCPSCGSAEFDQYGPDEVVPESTATPAAAVDSMPASSLAPPATPPSWSPDPLGRHELRYWDGNQWTGAVVDGGVPGIDAPV